MGCSTSKIEAQCTATSQPVEILDTEGCYLYVDSDQIYCKYCVTPPESIILGFATARQKLAPGRIKQPARYLGSMTNNTLFLKAVLAWVLECAPLCNNFKIVPEATKISLFPIALCIHTEGNNIFGDHVKICKAGDPYLNFEQVDAIAIIPEASIMFKEQVMKREEFIRNAQMAGGVTTRLDHSGKVPPL